MLSVVTISERRAAQALSQSSYWPALNSMLQSELAAIYSNMTDQMNVITVHQLQGRAKALKELLQVILTASSTLEKINAQPSRQEAWFKT